MENQVRIGDEEGEERETEKMEKFFSIIRNFRAARDRRLKELMMKENEEEEEFAAGKKIKLSPSSSLPPRSEGRKIAGGSNWIPTFEWEDFTRDHVILKREKSYRGKKRKGEDAHEEEEEEEDDLKLKLSLS